MHACMGDALFMCACICSIYIHTVINSNMHATIQGTSVIYIDILGQVKSVQTMKVSRFSRLA